MLIDTHAHVNFNVYKDDADEVIHRSLNPSTGSGQVWMINIGSQYDTSKRAVEMAEKYEKGVYAAVALHPIHLGLSKFIDKEEIDPFLKFKIRQEQFESSNYRGGVHLQHFPLM